MRTFTLSVLFLAVGSGIAGLALGWFPFASWPRAGKTDLVVTVASDEVPVGHETFFGVIQPNLEEQTRDVPVLDRNKDRDEFHREAETRLRAMDLNLLELNAKAKTGHAVTQERMNEAIADLTKRTESVRTELRELKAATPVRWMGLKSRLAISLQKLESGFEQTFSRFMNESAQLKLQVPQEGG